ncbi:capsule biosynthesis protein [Pasteurellaceae bacterium RH1A]|nr:capsule biosynthesis protein [Pasteurellaceae bacterium RH1A]
MLNHNLDKLVENSQRVLLLQGPIGSFFADLALWLKSYDKVVYKINLNAGDEYFYPNTIYNTIPYRDSITQFYLDLYHFVEAYQIDTFVCFGDNRKYHKVAKKIASELKLNFWVLEEGYFRPDYITLEDKGVNAFSLVPREADFFLTQASSLPEPPKPQKLAKGFCPMAKRAVLYYAHAYFKRKKYPKYQHHRILNVKYYIKLWFISGLRRLSYFLKDRSFAKKINSKKIDNFFIVPLQVYDDSQVRVHCDYESVGDFLREVLSSFAQDAPLDLNLIVKHHPMDRGFIDYQVLIDEFEEKYPHLKGRIYYVHDVPLPVFLRHGRGMVTLNSTSGISALLHNMPVITLGRANYDFEGLTHQGSLAEFWHQPQAPDPDVFEAYRKYHLYTTQLNGNFYNRSCLNYPYNNNGE